MNKLVKLSVAMCGTMLLTAVLAKVATPTHKLADTRPVIDLKTAIPLSFGDWEEDRAQISNVVNPTAAAEIQRIYAQTLSRTYVNRSGERIMLSIAYGKDQTDSLSVHFPEGCYGGQGFAVTPTSHQTIDVGAGVPSIPMARLVAKMYSRNEPISYWVIVGDKAVNTAWGMKKTKLAYAMQGMIADATLMRVSSVTDDEDHSYKLQQQFVGQMLAAMPSALRLHFAGAGH